MKRLQACTGARIINAIGDINEKITGKCEKFEERGIGAERFNFLTGFSKINVCTVILRGGAEQFIAESERSFHDALMVVRRSLRAPNIIGGAGSIEMQLSALLNKEAKKISGKE